MVWLRQGRDLAGDAARYGRRVIDETWFGYVKGEIPQVMLLAVGSAPSMTHDVVAPRGDLAGDAAQQHALVTSRERPCKWHCSSVILFLNHRIRSVYLIM